MDTDHDSVAVVAVKRSRGRPRTFDTESAIRKAMMLFWEHGYEGTSHEMLLAAMDIRPSSFQNAFGGKEALYRLAVEHYVRDATAWFAEVLGVQGTTRDAFENMFAQTALVFMDPSHPVGCMVSASSTQMGPDHLSVRDFVAEARRVLQSSLERRIREGIRAGDVGQGTHPDEVAAFSGTVLRGMAIQARDGISLDGLRAIGRQAVAGWPAIIETAQPNNIGEPI